MDFMKKLFLIAATFAVIMSSCVSAVGLKMDKARELAYRSNAIETEEVIIGAKAVGNMSYFYFKNKTKDNLYIVWNDSKMIDKESLPLDVSNELVNKFNPFNSTLQNMLEETKEFKGTRNSIIYPGMELTESLFFYKSGYQYTKNINGGKLHVNIIDEKGNKMTKSIDIID
jgi:hypothetical protein